MREIGSEFWQQYEPVCREKANNEVYLLSGRTALRFIIDDIRRNRNVRRALLPSYCCDSMIFPFVQSGIDVEFYQVHADQLDYPYGTDADIVFLIDFFGYVNEQNREIACCEKQAGKIILYDSTHKIDGNQAVEAFADYSFCSYRKWFYCNYAKVVKHHGAFNADSMPVWHESYMKLRDAAASEKERYITGLPSDKQRFLSDFRIAEQILDEDYTGYAGIPVDVDVQELAIRRRENAAYLLRGLREISQISLWRESIGHEDTPMFVPILVDPHIRNDLRSYLINRAIYCPVHWPKSPYHGVCNELYDMELSLVCDQRYDFADMDRVLQAIKDYFTDKG